MFRSPAAEFVYVRTYSRWIEDQGRRENWPETVKRYVDFITKHLGDKIPPKVLRKVEENLLSFSVMPSMRFLWAAGAPAEQDNVTIYNCSFAAVDNPLAFSEALYILMCMPKGSLVDTEKGPKKIEDINAGELVWSFNHKTNTKELKPVIKTHRINVDKKDQIKIKTLQGEFAVSNKHEIPVFENGDWKYKLSSELKIGDIVHRLNHWENEEEPLFDKHAYWTGAFLGDGCYDFNKYNGLRIRMTGDNENVISNFSRISSEISGTEVGYGFNPNKQYNVPVWITEKQYGAHNKLHHMFFDMVGDIPQKKCKFIRIPEWIKGSVDVGRFLSFLGGLVDTDGNVTKENKLQIATSSPFLKDDLIQCLSRFNIPVWHSEVKPEDYHSNGYKPTSSMYKITISLASLRGFDNFLFHEKKKERISKSDNDRKWWSKRKIVVPNEFAVSQEKYMNPKHVWHFNRKLRETGYVGEGYWKNKIPRELYKFDRITDIILDQDFDEEFCDLTVKDNHNYYGGIKNYYLVHNCGTGYGFSVENKYISQLPEVPKNIFPTGQTHIVEDSRTGWAESVRLLIDALYSGQDFDMDYNKVRSAGTRLKTMGGRSSGPGPLAQLHSFIKETFNVARGRKLTSLECHDILNEIAQIVVVGGVRRSSEISLSDLDDELMRNAKTGNFPVRRYMANNSAIYYSKPDIVTFMKEWASLIASGSGERGISNLFAARELSPKRRDKSLISGSNPCHEIMLRSQEFCNLSEVVTRADDDIDTMLEKVETATWAGIIQACFTNFPYLSKKWKENCDEERLLGVSITGQFDAPHLFTKEALKAYKSKAIKVAKKASEIMGIPMPAAITCVKPSGTVSQLVDSSSGLHQRFAKYYIRRYRIAAVDPLFRLIRDQGLPVSPENGQRKQDYVKALKTYEYAIGNGDSEESAIREAKGVCPFFDNKGWSSDKVNTWIVSFPVASPKNAITVEDVSAIEQLEHYKKIQKNWCEHNASITVYVKPDEWLTVGDWVFRNWDIVNGISFLPVSEHVYEQAPYEKITKEEYDKMAKAFPKIDYTQLGKYETEDNTEGAKSLACAGGACDL